MLKCVANRPQTQLVERLKLQISTLQSADKIEEKMVKKYKYVTDCNSSEFGSDIHDIRKKMLNLIQTQTVFIILFFILIKKRSLIQYQPHNSYQENKLLFSYLFNCLFLK